MKNSNFTRDHHFNIIFLIYKYNIIFTYLLKRQRKEILLNSLIVQYHQKLYKNFIGNAMWLVYFAKMEVITKFYWTLSFYFSTWFSYHRYTTVYGYIWLILVHNRDADYIASFSLEALILDDSRHVSEHFYARRVYLHHWRSHKWHLPLYTAQFNNSSTCLDKVRSGISSCKKLSFDVRNMDQSILSFSCDG